MEDLLAPKSTIRRVVRHQARMVKCLLDGRPIKTPPLVSATLDEDDVALAKTWLNIEPQWFTKEPVQKFEAAFAEWNGSKVAFSFMGGRVALSAAIHGIGLNPGDEVIVPGYTCIVVPNAFNYANIKVVYADIELETFGLDIASLRKAITPNTKAILIHHLFGLVCRDYAAIIELAHKQGLKIIEDCAHATGAEFNGRRVGNEGDVAFYSTEASKVLNTVQGGIVTTNSDAIANRITNYYKEASFPSAQRVRLLLHNVVRQYYQNKHPQRWLMGDVYRLLHAGKELISTTASEEQGIKPSYYGNRMPAPLAAIGLNQLQKSDHYRSLRTQGAMYWHVWCDKNNLKKPLILPHSKPSWLRYPVCVDPSKKKNTSWAERELGVKPGVWFVSHLHPTHITVPNCPKADIAIKQCINFPTLIKNRILNSPSTKSL